MERSQLIDSVSSILDEIRAIYLLEPCCEENTRSIDNKDQLYAYFTSDNQAKPEIHGGFALVHWDRDPQWEEQLKNDLKVTIRCIPEKKSEPGTCIFSGKESPCRVVLAKSY